MGKRESRPTRIKLIPCDFFQESGLFLRQAVLFVPLAKSTKILPFFHGLGAAT